MTKRQGGGLELLVVIIREASHLLAPRLRQPHLRLAAVLLPAFPTLPPHPPVALNRRLCRGVVCEHGRRGWRWVIQRRRWSVERRLQMRSLFDPALQVREALGGTAAAATVNGRVRVGVADRADPGGDGVAPT